MDLKALFTISHGVYLTGARDEHNRLIGSCIDAVMVAEAEPAQVLVSLNKQSYTAGSVFRSGRLTLSVLPADVPDAVIRTFGMQSSRTVDKWAVCPYHLEDDMPVSEAAVATLVLRVVQTVETAGHYVFLCDVITAKPGTMKKPLIYADYQARKRKENQMAETKKWVCTVCGYVYDGDIPFEELPEDWVCPLCGEPKSVFVQE